MPSKFIRNSFLLIVLIISFMLAVTICMPGCNKSRSGSNSQAIFDLSHREIFSPDSDTEMGLSKFSKNLSESGYKLIMNKQPISSKLLGNSSLLVLAGPMTEFAQEELQAITDYVKDGGSLLILVHISQPVLSLAERFDIQPSLATICDETNPVEDSPQDFFVTEFADHPIGSKVNKIAVFGTWGLRTREGGSAHIVAKTSEKAWADLNQDRVLNKEEPQDSYGIIAISDFGNGKVVICADDAILINKFLEVADNQQLGKNIVSWFKNKVT